MELIGKESLSIRCQEWVKVLLLKKFSYLFVRNAMQNIYINQLNLAIACVYRAHAR